MKGLVDEIVALPRGEAVFDMDGTLIEGDIGESALRAVDRAGHRNAATEGIASLWGHYTGLADYQDQCRFAVEALGGLDLGAIAEIVDGAFAEGEVRAREAVCELAHALTGAHRVWILTGSAEVLGVEVGKRLGIRHVFGLRQERAGGRLGHRTIGPVTGGPGKIQAMWEHLGRRPVFAIGDSPHDLAFLREARIARTTGKVAGTEFPAFP